MLRLSNALLLRAAEALEDEARREAAVSFGKDLIDYKLTQQWEDAQEIREEVKREIRFKQVIKEFSIGG